MKLTIPELCLVVLIGPSGSGKSTFARRHFKPTEILSSDFCRGLVSDDENSQDATNDAFDVLKYIAAKRLAVAKLTVIDATNVQEASRRPLTQLAREHDVLAAAIVLNLPEKICQERNIGRAERNFGPHVIRGHIRQLRRSLRGLEREGFRYVYVLSDAGEVEQAQIDRQRLWNNRKDDHGPFDIIGDVHGCYEELIELLEKLGYDTTQRDRIIPPAGRKAIFLGDLVDRGPNSPDVLRLVWSMVERGTALCLPGNHDVKLMRKLRGRNVQVSHGLAETLDQLEKEPPEFSQKAEQFIDSLIGHYVLDDGKLVVAHAGIREQYIGRTSRRVREFALYGDTTGETDEFGLPVRNNWAAEYRGSATIVYGHTPVPQADWLNRTINIDTGCVFGGALTALRYPEREIVSVKAKREYAAPKRPFLSENTCGLLSAGLGSLQLENDDVLDIDDVLGKRIITTRLHHNVTVREENAIAALEVMSRFAANPKWLIYLPPTMSPTETSSEPDLLEHPRETFAYFAKNGVRQVVCEEKHMGSRAVVIVCRDDSVALKRFGVRDQGGGIIYTRTGRRFFDDASVEREVLDQVREALRRANFWTEFTSDWFCLDCELMPWSAKAQELLKQQYAAVGAAATASLASAGNVLDRARCRLGDSIEPLVRDHHLRTAQVAKYIEAYRQYCWPVNSASDLRLAPFHLLASEGAVHVEKDHVWHMQTTARLAGNVVIATNHLLIDLEDPSSIDQGIAWWNELTSRGGEGMVIKPREFVVRGTRGLVQPAIKCRGKEYLRIIYGPEYDAPQNLVRLRARSLGAKRSLALREFALGIESLERFVRREPLRRVHECVFGVLALESEPVDPRL